MNWPTIAYILLLLVTTFSSTLLSVYAWRRRPATGAFLFTVMMLAVGWWALTYALEIVSPTLMGKLFWARLQYVGVTILPVAWLAFALEYSNRENWLSQRNVILLSFVPLVTFVLAWTNPLHGFLWSEASLATVQAVSVLTFSYGPWFWVFIAFSYGCLVAGSALLFTFWQAQAVPMYRFQARTLLIWLLLPWAGNVAYLFGATAVDLTPMIFSLAGLALFQYAFRFRLFDIHPMAHRAVLDSMEDGVLVLDTQDRVVDVNPAAQFMLQKPDTSVVGRPLQDVWSELSQRTNGSSGKSVEMVFEQSGDRIYYEVSVSPLYDWRKQMCGRLFIMRDVTERKELERLRDDMTRSMVHDLRAPISNTLFALQMLKGDLSATDVAADSHMLLDMTFNNTEKTLQMVNQILDLSRLESGDVVLVWEKVCLAEVADSVLTGLSSFAEAAEVRLVNRVEPDAPAAWADRKLVERVLQNLVNNGVKFSPEGGEVVVETAVTPDDPDHIQVRVVDQGPGIGPELQEVIFEKFVSGESEKAGTGLGLAFCRMALAAHKQRIWIESDPAVGGTAVCFTLAKSNGHHSSNAPS